ncbi:hypothetical protein RHS01_02148 [Rhizoctonia solani]|uniref:Uncharacterized protein n=1 Tax=Rhizoctonia solani TaxID=456999 RepID=A0A8H7IIR2_9AGAM|nr:hypothetical protein RHS01_02148 [Rhizoctonia solani]
MISRLGFAPSQPEIEFSQYTSPNRQMSLPTAPEGGSNPMSLKRFTKPPKEALTDMAHLYLALQSQFYYPSLRFEDGEPMMTESYAETQHYLMKLQELLDELEALKVVGEDEARKTRLTDEIKRASASVKEWIEKEKIKAQKLEERIQFLIAEEERKQELQPEASGCVIA